MEHALRYATRERIQDRPTKSLIPRDISFLSSFFPSPSTESFPEEQGKKGVADPRSPTM